MDINDSSAVIKKLSLLSPLQINELLTSGTIELSFFLTRKQKNAANYYHSIQLALDFEVRNWLVGHIVGQLNDLKNEETDEFIVSDYNFEFQKNECLAMLDVLKITSLAVKYANLKSSFDIGELIAWEKSNFQIVRIIYENSIVYFGFYRTPQKMTKKKKYMIFESNEWKLKKNQKSSSVVL